MAYAIQSDLAARLAPELLTLLADDDGDGAADAAVVNAVLADASAEIDKALSGRYATPFAGTSEILVRWCTDLAVERLFLRKREAISKEFVEAAALTRRALTAIAQGAANLAGAEPRAIDLASDNTERGESAAFDDEELDLY